MIIHVSEIKKMFSSISDFKNFSVFLSVQEIERLVEILQSSVVNMGKKSDFWIKDSYATWVSRVKPEVVVELTNAKEFFGLRDLANRFPTDDFLRAVFETSNKSVKS